MPSPVYLDYNATTPVASEVADAMIPHLREDYGNPSSSHAFGRRAHAAVDEARAAVARLIGAAPAEVIFTGCATEANNLAILGVTRALAGSRRHVVTSAIEHPAIVAPCRRLVEEGTEVTVVPVDGAGRVDPEAVARAMRDDTALVSIMHANNEIGTLQDIAAIARIAHARGALMHTDAAQSIAKVAVDVDALGIDLLSIAGHKFYAPKGVGALYIRTGTPVHPVVLGADHEGGIRPGTENVPGIVGLGAAARLGAERLREATPHLCAMRDALHQGLAAAIPGIVLNGHPVHRLPNTLNVSFPLVHGRALLAAVDDTVAASLGSACHAESDAVSGVLAAIGADIGRALGAVRFSVGLPTTRDEIDRAVDSIVAAWHLLRPA